MDKDAGRALRRKACQLLKRFAKDGAEGGTIIIHGERKKHLDGTECERDKCHKKHVWVWGPHIHYIGYGFLENSDYFHAQTGWIYKRVDDTKDRERDFQSTAFYLLTHSANFVDEFGQRHGIGYHHVGWMANCKGGKRIIENRLETAKCSCGLDLHTYGLVWDGLTPTETPDFEHDRGPQVIRIKVIDWYVNGEVFRQRTIDDIT
jgi:hypothetical protein